MAADDLGNADSTFVGGSGSTDEMIVDLVAQSTAATVSGFETLTILDSDEATVDMDNFVGVTTIDLQDVDTDALTINNVNGETVKLSTGVGWGSR